MGSNSIELADLPPANSAFRSSDWTPDSTFPPAVTGVIQKYFPGGYSTRDVGSQHFYLTTFRTLETADPQLVSQIAIIVSHPYDLSGSRISFRVQYVIRDKPRFSAEFSTGDDTNKITQTAATDFLNVFLKDVSSQGVHK
jgi:hypothetical protein